MVKDSPKKQGKKHRRKQDTSTLLGAYSLGSIKLDVAAEYLDIDYGSELTIKLTEGDEEEVYYGEQRIGFISIPDIMLLKDDITCTAYSFYHQEGKSYCHVNVHVTDCRNKAAHSRMLHDSEGFHHGIEFNLSDIKQPFTDALVTVTIMEAYSQYEEDPDVSETISEQKRRRHRQQI